MIVKLELPLRHVTLSFHLGMFYINFNDIIDFERENIRRKNEVFMLLCIVWSWRQLAGIGPFLLIHGAWTQAIRFSGKQLSTLSHLLGSMF